MRGLATRSRGGEQVVLKGMQVSLHLVAHCSWGDLRALYYPLDCSLLGSSVHGIFQARILEHVAISFSRGSSQPRGQTHVSCIAGGFFTR